MGLAVVLAVPLLALLEKVLKALDVPAAVLVGIGIAGAVVTVAAVAVKWRDERRAKERADKEARRRREEALAGALAIDPPLPLPRVGEVDPYRIGVRWSALVERFGYLREAESRPPYLRRGSEEEQLDGALQGQAQFILLRGDSSAGKSRMAFESALRTCAESQIIVPRGPSGLRTLLELDPGVELESDPVIIWLDELDGYVGVAGTDALTADRLARFRSRFYSRRIVVLATIRDRAFGDLHREDNPLRVEARALLDQAFEIELKQDAPVDDDQAEEAYAGADFSAGVGRFFTAIDELIDRYGTGRQERSDEAPRESELGVALLRAAIDWHRAGLRRPVERDVLVRLARIYLEDDYFTSVEEDAALAWARVPVSSGVRPLAYEEGEAGAGFRAADPLLDHDDATTERGPRRRVATEAWRLIVAEAGAEELYYVGFAAFERGELDAAEAAAEAALAAGGVIAGAGNFLLRRVAEERGEAAAAARYTTAAERLLLQEAEAGDVRAAMNLAALLHERALLQGRRDLHLEAEEWMRRAAEAGAPGAAARLGSLLDERGAPEAEEWWRRAGLPRFAASNDDTEQGPGA